MAITDWTTAINSYIRNKQKNLVYDYWTEDQHTPASTSSTANESEYLVEKLSRRDAKTILDMQRRIVELEANLDAAKKELDQAAAEGRKYRHGYHALFRILKALALRMKLSNLDNVKSDPDYGKILSIKLTEEEVEDILSYWEDRDKDMDPGMFSGTAGQGVASTASQYVINPFTNTISGGLVYPSPNTGGTIGGNTNGTGP